MHTLLLELLNEHRERLPVEVFLQAALHDPQHGYYARRAAIGPGRQDGHTDARGPRLDDPAGSTGYDSGAGFSAGAGGDFSTAATFHPALAWAIAAWAARHRYEVRTPALWRGRWHLIEIGAGTGELAAALLRALPFLARRGLVYHVVESSPHLTAVQQQRLAGYNVHWHRTPAAALEHAGGAALIFSNELVDAFPAAVFRSDGNNWQELYLQREGEKLVEVAGPCREETLTRVAAATPTVWESAWRRHAGQQVEIHLAYREWLETWLPRWRRGRMLTIDYGDTLKWLYHRRPGGTLRAYFHQQRFDGDDVYQHFGRQDVTCDVNFSDLICWGEALGLTAGTLATQAKFLQANVPRLAGKARRDARLAFLLDPHGMGGAVHILEQKPSDHAR